MFCTCETVFSWLMEDLPLRHTPLLNVVVKFVDSVPCVQRGIANSFPLNAVSLKEKKCSFPVPFSPHPHTLSLALAFLCVTPPSETPHWVF